ncbi:hypothetical protein PUNSTDRAFT_109219 [Punctularia strigosozonata HHB-11173 SS5]|uniref:U3-containing 90S pre-ribosomal complex subunit-domain containing protein n=1 Tax=Punctularia strigosozonata (strain HHB-11173) TaxID=741275 RepID=R7S1E6_PUNST|nr:uncharacterized protein PUNSTDRAFT_109219 [Punctularia strigosozonata HHB-11173 SS5]EIN03607.1 hypothetical protein PUNSTDRAFT_109219 [Punctularia strigosozonata HHB-11173 SS5]
MAGDELVDDFVPDDLVALSGDEVDLVDDDAEVGGPSPDESENEAEKRKAEEKKRKRSAKEKERKAKKRKLKQAEEPSDDGTSIAARPPSALATYIAAAQAKTFSEMSELELEDLRVPESAIADTTAWTGPRTLDQLPEFIIKMLPRLHTRLAQKPKRHGAPTLLFLSGAALRVADATRVLKDKRLRGDPEKGKAGEVAKLFAKHIRFEEHVSYLKRASVAAAAGTPGRVGKLLMESDALSVTALTHIILDVTHTDLKKRSLLSIPETRDEVFKTVLGAPEVLQGIKEGKIQVVLF